ncbi:inactive protein RESTRICTED TEV MOVEMENT 2-like [Abrus precatorius]|uniref:Inactive protein RESTRICTED TEV MOVEMENT 2-like n=1 Tax=Abrus precatorius TaxID=3816 RepID=A0A8B8KH13_ABRPR|nr:inactive protein RESTRICTED TEV MOVEMENT 2-like [Abrus precatorius]
MAMRPRTPRTQPSVRPEYEKFNPKSEIKETDEAYVLHIYLPGFVKEMIKINFVTASRTLRVVGERPINANRMSHFEQTHTVPENCEAEKLLGKFEYGTLTITMPKKSIMSPKAQIETTTKKGPTPISPSRKTVPDMRPKPPTTRMQQEEEPIRDKRRPQYNVTKETMLKATPPRDQMGKSQKGQEEIEPKPTSTIEDKREEEMRKKAISYIETIKRKIHDTDEKKNEVKEDGKPYEAKMPEKYIDHNMVLQGKEIKARKSPKEAESSYAPKAQEKGKETIDKAKVEEDEMYTIGKGIKEVAASASEVVTRIGEGNLNEEEKPLVANMGAAVLVIVALGSYLTYKFISSGKA